jgi:mRNA-degrading endonuclease YafQ of YafQ-DinJ toxin-antitoxin module
MQINFSNKFCKIYAKTPKEIKESFKERLSIFKNNKFDKILNNHQLSGDYSFLRSINITGDWRALFIDNNEIVDFVILGNHNNLYK